MLSANTLFDLPLELRVYIAKMDTEVYSRMYFCDEVFRKYANEDIWFKKQIRYLTYGDVVCCMINNIQYAKTDRYIAWYVDNILHNLNGPAKIYHDGSVKYYVNGELHRVGGPAIISHEPEAYHINDKQHRIDGPASICSNGYKAYYVNGKLHRDNGPARVYPNGNEEYWCNGVMVS